MLPCSCSPGLNTEDFQSSRLEEPSSQGKDLNFRNRGSAPPKPGQTAGVPAWDVRYGGTATSHGSCFSAVMLLCSANLFHSPAQE